MNELEWIKANLPTGVLETYDESEGDKLSFNIVMPGQIWIGCYSDKTSVTTSQYFIVGSPEWNRLQSALDFAQRIEQRRKELGWN